MQGGIKDKNAFLLIVEQEETLFSKRALATNIAWKLKNAGWGCGKRFTVIPLPATIEDIKAAAIEAKEDS